MKKISKRIEESIKEQCKKLGKAGYDISFKEIQNKFPKARGNINEFHPVFLLYSKGYGRMLELGKKIRKNKNLKTKKIKEMTVLQAIKLIKKARGVSVLAHPWIDEDALKERNFKRYVKAGLRGIEINNGDRFPFKKKGTSKRIRKLARKYNLILTSGSDYHGLKIVEQMPGNHELGKNNGDEKVVEELKKFSELNN